MAVSVSGKTYHIKDDPYFEDGERIVGDFTSAGHPFHEISIDEYEGDLEIWYIDRNDPSGSVLAYANGTWEIEYKHITFDDGAELSDADFRALTWAYDEYIAPKRLYITYNGVRKLGKINGKLKGTFAYNGVAYPFDNDMGQRLSAPTNLTISDYEISFDAVENAESYSIEIGDFIGVDTPNIIYTISKDSEEAILNLEYGIPYDISVRATATGYEPSPKATISHTFPEPSNPYTSFDFQGDSAYTQFKISVNVITEPITVTVNGTQYPMPSGVGEKDILINMSAIPYHVIIGGEGTFGSSTKNEILELNTGAIESPSFTMGDKLITNIVIGNNMSSFYADFPTSGTIKPKGMYNITFEDELFVNENMTEINIGKAYAIKTTTTTWVRASQNNHFYYSKSNCLLKKSDHSLIFVGDTFEIPDGTLIIPAQVFLLSKIGDGWLDIPESVTTIMPNAFKFDNAKVKLKGTNITTVSRMFSSAASTSTTETFTFNCYLDYGNSDQYSFSPADIVTKGSNKSKFTYNFYTDNDAISSELSSLADQYTTINIFSRSEA